MEILESARRHGVSDDDIRHALRNAMNRIPQDDGFVMHIGPDRTGRLLEVGVVGDRVIHAMPARPKYLE